MAYRRDSYSISRLRPDDRARWGRFPRCLVGAALVAVVGGANLSAQAPELRLIEAVRTGQSELAVTLLPDVDVNAAQADGATALHWAAYFDDEMLAARLVASGADAGAANDLGVTPLSLACENGSPSMVGLLLKAGADPNAAMGTGETVLMGCARTGSTDAVRALLVAGADVDAREQSEDQTALMWGVAQRHAGVVRLLIEYGADVAARSRERRKVISRRLQSELKYGELGRNYGTDAEETRVGGFTPLLFAARQGDVPSARLLLGAGADVNDRAPDGASALVVAVHSDHRALALFLLEQGANPAAASAGYTALHAAVLTGDLVVVEALLAHGARPDAQVTLATKVTRNGQVLMIGEHLLGATPFALAAKFTEVEIMRVLAAADADARLPLKNGWTPLMLAAGASWRYAVWDRRDRALAKAPAFQAQMYDEVATLAAVTLVADLGVDLNAVDADGSTALHHIVDKGFAGVVQRLVDRGADLAVANSRGQTPLSIVERGLTGNVEAAATTTALLRSLGAS